MTSTSREETTAFIKEMGATHTMKHREDVVQQIKYLKISTLIGYVFPSHAPADKYIKILRRSVLPLARSALSSRRKRFLCVVLNEQRTL